MSCTRLVCMMILVTSGLCLAQAPVTPDPMSPAPAAAPLTIDTPAPAPAPHTVRKAHHARHKVAAKHAHSKVKSHAKHHTCLLYTSDAADE